MLGRRRGEAEGGAARAQDEHTEAGTLRTGHLPPHPALQELPGCHGEQGRDPVSIPAASVRGESVFHSGVEVQL